MPRGDHLKGKGGRLFSKDNQPSPAAKSVPKKITRLKQALEFFSQHSKTVVCLEDGTEVELTYESNIALQLLRKANDGDLNAIKILAGIMGWNAPTNQNHNVQSDIFKLIESGDIVIDESRGDTGKRIPQANVPGGKW